MAAPTFDPLAEHSSAALVSRAMLRKRLVGCTEAAGVIHLDILRFRDVNERWGPPVGDSALALVVRRALHAAPPNTLLADAGSTIIALLVGATPEETRQAAAQLMIAVREPIQLGTIDVQLDVRAGYACARAGEVGLELLDHAQSAHRAAKDQERATPAEYKEELGRETTRAQRIEAELYTAISEGDLRAHFQPVVDLRDGRVVGLEALVRWPRRPGALLLPDEFLPVAEAAGLMPDVGQWMLQRVLDALGQLRDTRHEGTLRVWINLGAHEVAGADEVLSQIEAAIGDGTLNPREIGFEVTESTVLEDLDSAVESLAALRRLGVEIALDDFGTGYSSLSYLRRLPVTAVKIDRSFVAGLGRSPEDEAIVEAVIDLAHALGLRVIAEGVEDVVQVDALVALGADEAQGFLFGTPVPIEELPALLDQPWPWLRRDAGQRAVDRRADALPGTARHGRGCSSPRWTRRPTRSSSRAPPGRAARPTRSSTSTPGSRQTPGSTGARWSADHSRRCCPTRARRSWPAGTRRSSPAAGTPGGSWRWSAPTGRRTCARRRSARSTTSAAC